MATRKIISLLPGLCLVGTFAVAQEVEVPERYTYATYLKYDTSNEGIADEYVAKYESPVLDKLVDDGVVTAWAWQSHVVGGWFRRLHTLTAADFETLLDARTEALSTTYAEDNAAGSEFAGICGGHQDYLWGIVHEKRASN